MSRPPPAPPPLQPRPERNLREQRSVTVLPGHEFLFEKSEAASVDLVALVDRMRALPTETEWLDFKRNHVKPEQLGAYLSALANEARLCNQPRGYLLFGIDDPTHDVVGTRFDPYATKARGNQDLLPWLAAFLAPNPGLEVLQSSHPEGRVLLLAVGPARDRPVTFMGKAYCRAGTSTTELHRHPEKERSLWTRASDWSFEWCPGARLVDLDPAAIAKAREQFIVKHPAKAAAVTACGGAGHMWPVSEKLNEIDRIAMRPTPPCVRIVAAPTG